MSLQNLESTPHEHDVADVSRCAPQTPASETRHRAPSVGTSLAAVHLSVGAVTLGVFLVSGAYMRMHEPPVGSLEPGMHVMFTSRHIYILSAALIHLVLGATVRSGARSRIRIVQRIGSVLLVLSAALLVAAFVVEPMAGRFRTPASSFGLYALFAGSLFHVVAGLWSRVFDRDVA